MITTHEIALDPKTLFCGLLLFRIGELIKLRAGFRLCSLILAGVLFFPRIGGNEHIWMNGVFQAVSIIAVFPLIVLAGAGSPIKGKVRSGYANGFAHPRFSWLPGIVFPYRGL